MKPKDRDMELFADELRDVFTNVYEPGNDDRAWLAVGEYVAQLLRTTNDCDNRQRHIDALDGQAALEERNEQIRQLKKNVELLAGSLRGTLNAMGSHGPCCCTTAYDLGVKALTTAGVGR